MSMDLLRVTDATQSRFAPAGARMLRVSGGESGGKNDADHQILARLASPSSTVRLILPGADAVLSISIELDEADSTRDSESVIDLADSEFGNDQLAVIMRWLGGRLGAHPERSTTSCVRWSHQMAAEARPDLYRPAYLRVHHARNASRGCRAEQNVLRRAVPGRHGLQAA